MNLEHLKVMPENWIETAKVFEAIGNEYRQKILLLFEKNESISIKEIVEALNISRTAVVFHIKVLEKCNVLVPEKKGLYVYYKLNHELILNSCHGIIRYIDNNLA